MVHMLSESERVGEKEAAKGGVMTYELWLTGPMMPGKSKFRKKGVKTQEGNALQSGPTLIEVAESLKKGAHVRNLRGQHSDLEDVIRHF
jgi:hypothetical protein